MTKETFPNAAAAYTPSDADAPTFDALREGGCMVIDDSLQKLAVYPGGGACVVIKEQHFDSEEHHVVVEQDRVPALIAALTKAQSEAAQSFSEFEEELRSAAHLEQGLNAK